MKEPAMLQNMRCFYLRRQRSSTLCVCLLAMAAVTVGVVWRFPSLFSSQEEQSAITSTIHPKQTQATGRKVVQSAGSGSMRSGFGSTTVTQSILSGLGSTNISSNSTSRTNSSKATETFPTSSPTESPAPSPSPSFVPTTAPSGTAKPTDQPTSTPTESPAPSPAPSETPSDFPTHTPSQGPTVQPTTTRYPSSVPSVSPSLLPSLAPSLFPTQTPTISSPPSTVPSVSPTNVPSFSPSISLQPSSSPSASPTASFQPSNYPTFVGTKTTVFTVTFSEFKVVLTAEEKKAFEQGTEEWIPQASVGEESALWQPVVKILQQRLVPVSNTNHTPPATVRKLREQQQVQKPPSTQGEVEQEETIEPITSLDRLSIKFQVTVVYKGSDDDFNLYLVLNPYFQGHNPLWIHLLGNYNDLFLQLRPPSSTIPPAVVEPVTSQSSVTLSSSAVGIIVFVVLAAMGLGVAAVTVSLREYRTATIGRELNSPERGGGDEDVFFANNPVSPVAVSMLPPNDDDYDDTNSNAAGGAQFYPSQSQQQLQDQQQTSILSFENASYPDLSQQGLTHNVRLVYPVVVTAPGNSGEREVVDPVEYYEPDNENYYDTNNDGNDNRSSLGDIFRGNTVFGRTGSDPPTANSEAGAANAYYNNQQQQQNHHHPRSALMQDNRRRDSSSTAGGGGHEIMLTATNGGTMGAKAVPSTPSEYTASQQSGSYYTNSNAGGGQRGVGTGSGTLGAKPLNHDDRRLSANPSFDSSLVPRAGLYDVFAPSGPIGIIVDTTKDGPAVHSLKASSPMLGLINPGDLIVALDDKDTRGMTAATLTRLMAKKASQKERKITLLATEQY